jgi:hypothetical protein
MYYHSSTVLGKRTIHFRFSSKTMYARERNAILLMQGQISQAELGPLLRRDTCAGINTHCRGRVTSAHRTRESPSSASWWSWRRIGTHFERINRRHESKAKCQAPSATSSNPDITEFTPVQRLLSWLVANGDFLGQL